jgi:hypothetical protein
MSPREDYMEWARQQLPDTPAEALGARLAQEAVNPPQPPPLMTQMGALDDLSARSTANPRTFEPGGYVTPSSFELERAKVMHALAAERLAMADKYAMVRKEVQRTRTESKSDYDPMKRLGLMASTAGAADTTELEDVKTRRAAEERKADKFGGLAFNYVSPDGKREELWAARPGTPEKEVQTLKENAGGLATIDKLLKEIDETRSAKDKLRSNAILTANTKAIAGILGGSLFNSGVVNAEELKAMEDIVKQQGVIGPDGLQAFRQLRGTLRLRYENQLRQAGASKVAR